ncbi:MAG: hypothetical protein U0172_09150 [Nitrospiraceae bacterium]
MNGHTPRPLTNDERKAAEAAFRSEPCNPEWSQSAREMYEGLAAFLALRSVDQHPQASEPAILEPALPR